MALKILPQSNLYVRGLINKPLNPDEIILSTHQPLYLYPTESSQILTNELIKSYNKPIQLIVPDGSWRQTRRFVKRESWLKSIPHIHLPDTHHTLFFLRRRVKAHGVSTFEAITRALGIIETIDLQSHMEIIFKTMIERTLKTRGKNLEQYL
jgi:DTW domain-containing protein YfiP